MGPRWGMLCCVVLFCRAMGTQHGSLERFVLSTPFTSPLGCISPNLQITMHSLPSTTPAPHSSSQLFAALPGSFLARADAPQRLQRLQHARPNTKFSPLCARRPPLSESPAQDSDRLVDMGHHGVHASQSGAVAGGGVIMDPSIHPSITAHHNGTGFLYHALYGKERPEPGADRHSLSFDYFVQYLLCSWNASRCAERSVSSSPFCCTVDMHVWQS
jgi:hypothetical protein